MQNCKNPKNNIRIFLNSQLLYQVGEMLNCKAAFKAVAILKNKTWVILNSTIG